MREGTALDAQGYHRFTLDEAQHDPFDVLARLIAAADNAAGMVPPTDPARDERYRRIIVRCNTRTR